MTAKSLSGHLKDKLIQQALERRLKKSAPTEQRLFNTLPERTAIPESWQRFDQFSGYQQLKIIAQGGAQLGISSPFFRVHDGVAGAHNLLFAVSADVAKPLVDPHDGAVRVGL